MLEWGGRRFRPIAPTTRVRNRQEAPIQRNRDNGVYLTGSFIQPNQQDGVAPPPPPAPTVSIAPSSAIQYENVSLSASTTGTSPTFTWTLVDFYDTTDTPITSYVGAVVPTGYFTTTGSSNVSVSMVCVEGTAVNSTFSVSEFAPSSISDMFAWIDFSDNSTITLRAGTDYIESITDKSGNWTLSQSNAAYQPLLLTGGSVDSTSTLQVASFDGTSDSIYNSVSITPVAFTAHTSFSMGTMKYKSSAHPQGRSMMWEIGMNFPQDFTNRRCNNYVGQNQQIEGLQYAFATSYPYTDYYLTYTDYPLAYNIKTDSAVSATQTINGQAQSGFYTPTNSYWSPKDFTIGTQSNQITTSNSNKFFGEYWESIHYSRDLTADETTQIDRYLQYKWLGTKQY